MTRDMAMAGAGGGVLFAHDLDEAAAEGMGRGLVALGLAGQAGEAPLLFVGHGAHGAVALSAIPASVQAVALLAAPATPEALAAVERLDKPLLLLHAPEDAVVSIHDAAALYAAARHPRSFVALDGADHGLSDPRDAAYAGDMIAAWAARYLKLGERRAAAYRSERESVATTQEGLQTQVGVRGFSLLADEPAAHGGLEAAPTPVDYLAVALSSCTAMTLRMYADRKGWPLQSATVAARQRKEAGPDGEKRDVFVRAVRLEGPLDAEQRARLLEIADRCPVHRTLEAGARVTTTLLGEADDPQAEL